jgi:CRISPR-associated protein Csm3
MKNDEIKRAEKIKLLGYQSIVGEIECRTGLRIGGGSEVIEIGGLDNPVIKHPITGEPYIPGSSLKGKMRSLLELKIEKIGKDGEVHKYVKECGVDCQICRLFGIGGAEGSPFGPGRLIIRDSKILRINEQPEWDRDLKKTEIKWENVINRIKGTADPRQMERVPAGTIFELRIDYRVFSVKYPDTDEDNGATDIRLFDWVFKGLKLIEQDTLGGSGSRGYGKVSFGTVAVTDLNGTKRQVDINADIHMGDIN